MLWNLAEAVKHGISGRPWVRNGSICLNPYSWPNYTNKETFEAKWGPLPWKLWNRFSDQHKSFFQKGRRNPKFRFSNNIIRSHFEKSQKVLHNLKAESSREFWWKRHPIWWTFELRRHPIWWTFELRRQKKAAPWPFFPCWINFPESFKHFPESFQKFPGIFLNIPRNVKILNILRNVKMIHSMLSLHSRQCIPQLCLCRCLLFILFLIIMVFFYVRVFFFYKIMYAKINSNKTTYNRAPAIIF